MTTSHRQVVFILAHVRCHPGLKDELVFHHNGKASIQECLLRDHVAALIHRRHDRSGQESLMFIRVTGNALLQSVDQD